MRVGVRVWRKASTQSHDPHPDGFAVDPRHKGEGKEAERAARPHAARAAPVNGRASISRQDSAKAALMRSTSAG